MQKAILTTFFIFGIIGYFNTSRCFSEEEKGPIGYWKFDEEKDAVAIDSSGQGNNGKITGLDRGAIKRVAGKFGNALEFNKETGKSNGVGYVEMPGVIKKYDFSKGITLQAWVKWVELKIKINSNFDIISNTTGSYGPGIRLKISGEKKGMVYFTSGKGSRATALIACSEYIIEPDKWYHVAASYDSSNGEGALYVNGKKAAGAIAVSSNITISNLTDNIYISSCTISTTFRGIIDEVKIYDYARSPLSILREARLEEYQ